MSRGMMSEFLALAVMDINIAYAQTIEATCYHDREKFMARPMG